MPREDRSTMSVRNPKRYLNAEQNNRDRMASALPQARRLSVKEASYHTGLSCSTLNKLRCSGRGPRFAKVGRRVLYDISDLDTWLAKHLKTSTSDL